MKLSFYKYLKINKKYLVLILPVILSIIIILLFLILKIDVLVFLEYEL
jgi:hypothetical protein